MGRPVYAKPSNPDIGRLIKELVAGKWSVTGGGTRHYRLACPNKCKCSNSLASSTANRLVVLRTRTWLKNHTCWEKKTCPAHPPAPSRQQPR